MDLKQQLKNKPEFKKYLFKRGFLITDYELSGSLSEYPFYGNWNTEKIGDFFFYTHKSLDIFVIKSNGTVLFLIGHAYINKWE